MGLVAPWCVGSSQTRARTRVPCIGRQILNHCTTREARFFLLSGWRSSFLFLLKNGCYILSNAFSISVEMDIFFLLLPWYGELFWLIFKILYQLHIPGINSSWLWCIIIFYVVWYGWLSFFGFSNLSVSFTIFVSFLYKDNTVLCMIAPS